MSLSDMGREDRLRLMKFVCSFAWADLSVADSERSFVHKLMRKMKLEPEEKQQVEDWLDVPPRAEELDPAEIPREHRKVFLATAREMIEADGAISEEELETFALFEQLLS